MPDVDDQIRLEFERLVKPLDESDWLDRIARKRSRHRAIRRVQTAALALGVVMVLVAVVVSVGGGPGTPLVGQASPTVTASPTASVAPTEEPTATATPTGEGEVAGPPGIPVAMGAFQPKHRWLVDPERDTMTEVISVGPEGLTTGETFPIGGGLDLVGVALSEASEAPLAGVYVHGNLAFVGGQSTGYFTVASVGVRLLDLSDPANPRLVGRIPLRSRSSGGDHSHGDAVATTIDSPAFRGDVAIVLNGVPDGSAPSGPDDPAPYGIWDLTNPSAPQLLSVLTLPAHPPAGDGGELGDKPQDAKAVAGSHLYVLQVKTPGPSPGGRGLAVVDLSDPRRPKIVGNWKADDEVATLALSLNNAGTRAYIAGVKPPPFGRSATAVVVFVLDIRDPERPVELARYVHPIENPAVHTPHAVPNDDDSLLILADGSWGNSSEPCGRWGRLHIIDISNLDQMHELSTFKIAESDTCFPGSDEDFFQATDMAVRGNLVSSTWLKGGLHVVDIADPRNPVAVGEFRSPNGQGPWLSDVAVKGDLVVASTVWWSGLYIFSSAR